MSRTPPGITALSFLPQKQKGLVVADDFVLDCRSVNTSTSPGMIHRAPTQQQDWTANQPWSGQGSVMNESTLN